MVVLGSGFEWVTPSLLPRTATDDDLRVRWKQRSKEHAGTPLREQRPVAVSFRKAEPCKQVPFDLRLGWDVEKEVATEFRPRPLDAVEDNKELAGTAQVKELARDFAGLCCAVARVMSAAA